MITVTVETQRVYSHDEKGMAKIETIPQKLKEGANFNKFLKYLPAQGYIKVKILKATDVKDGKVVEVDKSPYEKMLNEVISKKNTPEETIQDKYNKEKERNDELLARLAALESRVGNEPKQELEKEKIEAGQEEKVQSIDFENATKAELSEVYKQKFGKKPFAGWKKEEIIEKLK